MNDNNANEEAVLFGQAGSPEAKEEAVKEETQEEQKEKKEKKGKKGKKAQPIEAGSVVPIRKISPQLQALSFLSGMVVMTLELTGSRLVAPFFGTSVIVWTALIGVMMISLCFGNWLGGALADRRPDGRILGRILFFAALVTALTAYASNAVLTALASLSLNLYVAAVLAALAIFTPASLLLGMVSPFVARLALRDVNSSGATVGRLSAWNSAGSILGTFLGGFVLISLFPSGVILMILATVMALLCALAYTGAWRRALLLALCLGGGAFWAQAHGLPRAPLGVQIDTRYNHVSIVESKDMRNGRRVRILMTDPRGVQSLMYIDDPSELVSEYTQFYDLAFYYKPSVKKVLMLGGGGYCVPRHLLSRREDISLDVVELDPGVTEAARRYFELKDDPRLRIFHEDARNFLNRAARDGGIGPYDAIFMDTFNSWYSIPFHLTTVETAQRVYDLLAPDGVLVMNTIAALFGPHSGVFHGIYSAFSQVFPRLLIFPASASGARYAYALQNLMLVGLRGTPQVPSTPDERFSELLAHQWVDPFTPDRRILPFTDAFAPVERYALMQ